MACSSPAISSGANEWSFLSNGIIDKQQIMCMWKVEQLDLRNECMCLDVDHIRTVQLWRIESGTIPGVGAVEQSRKSEPFSFVFGRPVSSDARFDS